MAGWLDSIVVRNKAADLIQLLCKFLYAPKKEPARFSCKFTSAYKKACNVLATNNCVSRDLDVI